jgi:hypothetical protein
MASALMDAIVAHAQRSPEAAPPYSLPGGILRDRQTNGITVLELAAAHSRWGE